MALFVQETGTPGAPSILFVHAIATSGWMWRQQVALLQDFHCLAVDLPGHGQSNALPWESLAASAEAVAAVIRARATGGRAHLVGLSLGGYVVAQLLSQTPELADHAILSGVAVLPHPSLRVMRHFGPLFGYLAQTTWMLRMNARVLKVPADQEQAYIEQARRMSRQAFVRANSDAASFTIPAGLREATCPTLAVAGQNEHALIHRSLTALIAAMPNAEARLVPGVGHGWNGEAPMLFGAMIRAWITDNPLPAELKPILTTAVAA